MSTAASAGITTAGILKAADWTNQSVFQKFNYKRLKDTSFGKAVLSKPATTGDKLQSHVDMETEHSEV